MYFSLFLSFSQYSGVGRAYNKLLLIESIEKELAKCQLTHSFVSVW